MIPPSLSSPSVEATAHRVLPHSDEPPFDRERFLARCLGNVSFAERMLAKFQLLFAEDLGELQQAGEQLDSARVARVAHRLKGSAANISAPRLRTALAAMEQLGRSDNLAQFSEHMEQLRSEWLRFEQSATVEMARAASCLQTREGNDESGRCIVE